MNDKSIAILLSLLILGQAFAVRRFVGTWLFPACLFGLFWFFMSFIPLVALWSVPIDPYGTGFIFLCLFFFSGSAIFFPWRKAFQECRTRTNYAGPFLRKSFYLLSVSAFLCMILNSLAQGITLRDIIFNSIATAASYREMFTSNHFNVTIWLRVAEILAYAVAAIGGLIISNMPTKWGRFRIIAATFVPTAFMAVAQSSKWTMFACIAFFYASVLTDRISKGHLQLLNKGSFKKIAVYAVLLFTVAAASFMSRGLQNSDDSDFIKDNLKLYFNSYAFGHLYSFSDWCAFEMGRNSQIHYDKVETSYGFYTFSPIFRTLGSSRSDVYEDEYSYEKVLVTNIYTLFRGLIQDFGVPGSLAFMFLLGLAVHAAFYALLIGRCHSLSATSFIFSIGLMYFSYGRSIFTWSGLYFTFALMCLLLWWNRNRCFLNRLFRSGYQRMHDEPESTVGVAI